MGISCSANYANLFMGKFEEDFLYNNNPYLSDLKCWYRYINDTFFIFSAMLALLQESVGFLNIRMPTIKFLLESVSLENKLIPTVCYISSASIHWVLRRNTILQTVLHTLRKTYVFNCCTFYTFFEGQVSVAGHFSTFPDHPTPWHA